MTRRVLLAALLLTSAHSASAQSWPATFLTAAPAIVRIEAMSDDGDDGGVCTGVVINLAEGYVVTAGHCALPDGKGSYTVGGKHAEIVKVNRLLDLAVLKAEHLPKDATQLQVASDAPPVGTPIAVIGYAFGARNLALQVGIVASTYDPNAADRLLLNADIIPGDSGGGVINATGQLLAITSAVRYIGPSHLGLAVPVELVRDFVGKYLPGASK